MAKDKGEKIVGDVQKFRGGRGELYEKPPKKVPANQVNAAVQEWLVYGHDHLPEIVRKYKFIDEKHAYRSIVSRLSSSLDNNDLKASRNEMSMKLRGLLNVLMPNAVASKRQMRDEKGAPIRDIDGNPIFEDNPMHLPSVREARAVIHDIATLEGLNAPQVHALITPDAAEFDDMLKAILSSQGHDVTEDAFDLVFAEDDEGIFREIEDDGEDQSA